MGSGESGSGGSGRVGARSGNVRGSGESGGVGRVEVWGEWPGVSSRGSEYGEAKGVGRGLRDGREQGGGGVRAECEGGERCERIGCERRGRSMGGGEVEREHV